MERRRTLPAVLAALAIFAAGLACGLLLGPRGGPDGAGDAGAGTARGDPREPGAAVAARVAPPRAEGPDRPASSREVRRGTSGEIVVPF
jgi:hypothetical protein